MTALRTLSVFFAIFGYTCATNVICDKNSDETRDII